MTKVSTVFKLNEELLNFKFAPYFWTAELGPNPKFRKQWFMIAYEMSCKTSSYEPRHSLFFKWVFRHCGPRCRNRKPCYDVAVFFSPSCFVFKIIYLPHNIIIISADQKTFWLSTFTPSTVLNHSFARALHSQSFNIYKLLRAFIYTRAPVSVFICVCIHIIHI